MTNEVEVVPNGRPPQMYQYGDLVEFGNENWNQVFRPAGIPDPVAHGAAATRAFQKIRAAAGANAPLITVPLNPEVDYDGGIATWIDNLAGERPFGNDLDPTLNLDVLEVSFRNCARWRIVETPSRLETVRRIVDFHRRLVASGLIDTATRRVKVLGDGELSKKLTVRADRFTAIAPL